MTSLGLDGRCDERFEGVARAMAKNFEQGDLGASVAVIHDGQMVVDLWGGSADVGGQQPWAEDTIVNVWSTTKTIAALTVLMLHERGELSIDDPIASVWPEFAAAGKESVLIRHALSHLTGLHRFDPPLTHEEMFDWDLCCARLAAQAPSRPPGTAMAYHAFTQGFLLGEVVRRVTGVTMGDWLRRELTEPNDVDFHLGVPADVRHRIAEMRIDEMPAENDGPDRVADVNTERWQTAEFPSSNGHGNARSIARLLSVLTPAPLIDESPVAAATIDRIREVQWDGLDPVTGVETRMGIGFGHSSPSTPLGVNDDTIFWGGLGGSMAVVDLAEGLVAVYAMNRMLDGPESGIRAVRVVHAAHRAIRD